MERIDETGAVIVCDAGPIIHLDELGCLDLLADFFEVLIPETVCREVERHRPGALFGATFVLRRVSPSNPIPAELSALVLSVQPA